MIVDRITRTYYLLHDSLSNSDFIACTSVLYNFQYYGWIFPVPPFHYFSNIQAQDLIAEYEYLAKLSRIKISSVLYSVRKKKKDKPVITANWKTWPFAFI